MTDVSIFTDVNWGDINTVVGVAPAIVKAVQAGQTPQQIVADLEPSVLKAIEMVANIFFPGSGSAISVLSIIITLVVQNSHRMTPAEEEAWFKRVQGDH